MLRRQEPKSDAGPASDVDSFRHQRVVFAVLNASLLAILLFLHSSFSSFWGVPSPALVALLGAGVLLRVAELLWFLLGNPTISRRASDALTWASIALNLVLAVLLASLLDRQDSQYFALLAIPFSNRRSVFPCAPFWAS